MAEQFHSEFKTDLDIERLQPGKFATNDLIMTLSVYSYNIMRSSRSDEVDGVNRLLTM
jgi:hypothetical protein